MMARLASLGLALGGAAYAAVIVPDPAARWKAIAERLFSTVVQVHGDESQHAAVSSASGVLIGEGLAVTTLHAVAVPSGEKLVPMQQAQIQVASGAPIDARVMDSSAELDLAILVFPDKATDLPAALLATELPAEGELLIAMGTGDEAVAVMGVVVSHVSGEVFTLASKRAIDARFRGGPLFDDRGRLAGILQVSEDGARAVSARAIQRMLDLRALSRGASRPR
ncbi:MAG TPA: serine protease [Myxococcales bacterium]|nr:serine protease [Myxococcales bacterium]